MSEWRSDRGDQSACQVILSVCLSVESMWHDSSRKGGDLLSLAGNKCTSLSLGLQPARPSALQVEWQKWEDVTFPKAAEVRWPISHNTWYWKRAIDCQWFWFWLRGVSGRPHDRCSATEMANKTRRITWDDIFFRVVKLTRIPNIDQHEMVFFWTDWRGLKAKIFTSSHSKGT